MLNYEIRILLMILAASVGGGVCKCDRRPSGTTKPRSLVGGKFHVEVFEYNRTDGQTTSTYLPNTKYLVTLSGNKFGEFPFKFTKFLIVAENKESSETGTFEIEDRIFVKFSDRCPNALEETADMLKEIVSVAWISPMENTGCISIKATVVESEDNWYMDESSLVTTLCAFAKSPEDDQGEVLEECCACDEAKYEVTFEGLWSRNTHPKDFPTNGWLTRFSDVIGASHTVDYRFWNYDGLASEGLRQVAERGATRMLESELKDESEHIRTIIKARGISYPNVTGKTFAVFRVDRKHHLMSLVSMIDPSPDWIVGVSGMELCLSNCTWIEHKELNLYPYDAGTDSGITYISPDSPTDPREPIHLITSTFPNDPGSPFYDETGIPMKPIAKLYLNRQRLYEKTCEEMVPPDPSGDGNNQGSDGHKSRKACRVSEWGEWSECSVTCGRGERLRQRHYLNAEVAQMSHCRRDLTGRSKCHAEMCPLSGGLPAHVTLPPGSCDLDPWTTWSSCTTSCGRGSKTRRRKFVHRKNRKYCLSSGRSYVLEQTFDCEDNEPCPDNDDGGDEVSETTEYDPNDAEEVTRSEEWLQKCPEERYTEWSMWTPCSSSCGPGVQLRSRLPNMSWSNMDSANDPDLEDCKLEHASCFAEIPSCDFSEEDARRICTEPLEPGNCRLNILRFYFDVEAIQCRPFNYTGCGTNKNSFPTEEACNSVCGGYQKKLESNPRTTTKNAKVSSSSVLSYHVPAQDQRSGKIKRAKHGELMQSTVTPDLGGMASGSQVLEVTESYSSDPVDCHVSEWSDWNPCHRACRGFTYRHRIVLIEPRNGGKKCPTKLEQKRRCRKMPSCSQRRDMRRRSYNHTWIGSNDLNDSVDCQVTSWSIWSPCTATCGYSVRHRTRNIDVAPRGPDGKLCPPLVQFATCFKPDCNDDTTRERY